jgi:Fe-S cluster biogenesis protein NfuA
MFIQTEDTPNPATLKFIPGVDVLPGNSAEFNASDDAKASPLASRLLRIDGVESVFLSGDFVSITKADQMEWFALKPSVLAGIMEHFASGLPVMDVAQDSEGDNSDDDEVVQQIKHLLDTRVRPAVAMDGGDITFHSFDEGVVTLQMRGACQGCPSSTATLKMGIENMLRHYIPEVVEVRPTEE